MGGMLIILINIFSLAGVNLDENDITSEKHSHSQGCRSGQWGRGCVCNAFSYILPQNINVNFT